MTVRELIDNLKSLDQDTDISVYSTYTYGLGWDYSNIRKIEKIDCPTKNTNTYVIY